MSPEDLADRVLLFRADDDYVENAHDKVEKILGNVLMAQSALVNYYEDVIPNVQTPHLKEKLEEFHRAGQDHLKEAEDLFRLIDREPSRMKEAMGGMMTKVQEMLTNVRGIGTGAYPDLQSIFILELMSTGAFGLTAQTAIALGIPEAREVAMRIAKEKFHHWRYLQESLMEYGPLAVVEERPI